MVADLRNHKIPASEDAQILSEIYFILTLGSLDLSRLMQYPSDPETQRALKKCLTSLKKMMGN